MSIEKFIKDSTEFFDNQVSKVSKTLEKHGHYPEAIEIGPTIEINGASFRWKLELNVAPIQTESYRHPYTEENFPSETTLTIKGEPRPNYFETPPNVVNTDKGWLSIDSMFKEPEFTEHFKEIEND